MKVLIKEATILLLFICVLSAQNTTEPESPAKELVVECSFTFLYN